MNIELLGQIFGAVCCFQLFESTLVQNFNLLSILLLCEDRRNDERAEGHVGRAADSRSDCQVAHGRPQESNARERDPDCNRNHNRTEQQRDRLADALLALDAGIGVYRKDVAVLDRSLNALHKTLLFHYSNSLVLI